MAIFFLLVYTISVLIRPHEWPIAGGGETQIIQISLGICLLAFLFSKNKNLKVPQISLILLLTLAIVLSVVASGWLGGAVIQGEEFIRQAVIPFILFNSILDTRRKQYLVFGVIILTSVIMVLNGHAQIGSETGVGWIGNQVYENQGMLRINYVGFFNDPNDMGMFLVMTIPVVLLFRNRDTRLLNALLWAIVALLLYGIYLTNSRGTLLAALAMFGTWYWIKYGTRTTLYTLGFTLPVLYYVLSNFREISTEEESAAGRIDAWYAGYQMLTANPIFGVGYGNFVEYHAKTAHNSFVLVMAELGLFGCLIWVTLMICTLILLLRISRRNFLPPGRVLSKFDEHEVEQEARIARTFLYCFLAFSVSAFFLSRTYVPFLYMFLGMASSLLGRLRIRFPDMACIYQRKELVLAGSGTMMSGIIGIYVLTRVAI